ncbi:hypothetical protein Scep_012948 [Stephania cephalantha]|uniref:Uncharacterized protein n=1 Tax=Stephania cephalantha TaxID=152367 RepID=A0AAP0PA25_9MAGN
MVDCTAAALPASRAFAALPRRVSPPGGVAARFLPALVVSSHWRESPTAGAVGSLPPISSPVPLPPPALLAGVAPSPPALLAGAAPSPPALFADVASSPPALLAVVSLASLDRPHRCRPSLTSLERPCCSTLRLNASASGHHHVSQRLPLIEASY